MTSKRKAGTEAGGLPRKIPKHEALDRSDLIYESYSDPAYSSSEDLSDEEGYYNETPVTPFSTTSSKYPSELKTHLCPFEGCTKAFNRPARLQEHLRSHNNERIFNCEHDGCDKTFLRASHLNHHIKSAHTAVRQYVCDRPGCGKTFVTGTRLRRHLAAHDGRDKYRCTEYPPCNEMFRKHSTLYKHIMAVHLKQKPFPCSHVDSTTGQKCPQAFDTAGHLRAHETRQHAENRFICTECSCNVSEKSVGMDLNSVSGNVSFATYAQLQTHIKSEHPPQCPNCPMVCSTSRELRRHLEIAHGDVSLNDRKVFSCTVPGCGRSFTKKGNLTVHVRTVHDGEKRFICGETDLSSSKKVESWTGEGCGKRYSSKLSLEEHVRTAHLGFPNARAERRERLGLNKSESRSKPQGPSTLALLTGEGYVTETGRHIACFIETCEHRFHRDYDLWVHMCSKHGFGEDEIHNLFTERALMAHAGADNFFGIYGLDLDTSASQPFFTDATTEDMINTGNHFDEQMNDMNFLNGTSDVAMRDLFDQHGDIVAGHSELSNANATVMDPALSHLMEE